MKAYSKAKLQQANDDKINEFLDISDLNLK